jgi:transcriptional regulator with XRE-family HTH domain
MEPYRGSDVGRKSRKAGQAWDVADQLAFLRKKAGLSQKELAKRVGTSQQQISRLESPSYGGHSLRMLRRVAEVLGASVRVEIQGKKQQFAAVLADVHKRRGLSTFELDFVKREKVDRVRNFRIAEGLYNEAVALGVIPSKNPLDGIEVDLKIARAVNRV